MDIRHSVSAPPVRDFVFLPGLTVWKNFPFGAENKHVLFTREAIYIFPSLGLKIWEKTDDDSFFRVHVILDPAHPDQSAFHRPEIRRRLIHIIPEKYIWEITSLVHFSVGQNMWFHHLKLQRKNEKTLRIRLDRMQARQLKLFYAL